MSSNAQLVPSRNALRALRKLALGGSATIGAVGSVSGLAFVSYDIRQRVHLAESVVETKKILQSQKVSNTNRKAHMSAIFDMYEQGQGKQANESWNDFNRRARRHSTQATINSEPMQAEQLKTNNLILRSNRGKDTLNSQSSITEHGGSVGKSSKPTVSRNACQSRAQYPVEDILAWKNQQNSPTVQTIIEASRSPHKVNSHTVYGRPKTCRDVSHVRQIITATQQQHKLNSHAVFGRPQTQKDEALPGLPSCVQQWLLPNSQNGDRSSYSSPSKSSGGRRKRSYNHLPVRRYTTTTVNRHNGSAHCEVKPLASEVFVVQRDLLSSAETSKERVEIRKLASKSRQVAPSNRHQRRGAKGEKLSRMQDSTPDVNIKILSLVNECLRKPTQRTTQFSKDISEFSAVSATPVRSSENARSSSPALKQLVDAIPVAVQRHGSNAARQSLRIAMQIYAQGGSPDDFRAIDLLYSMFCNRLRITPQEQPILRLIQYLLDTGIEENRQRANQLLFPRELGSIKTLDHSSTMSQYQYEQNALKYLGWLCQTDSDSINIIHDFRQILNTIHQEGGHLSESLFAPVLRMFVERGQLDHLRNLFDEMITAHGIKPTGSTKGALLLGVARAHDWEQVAREFDSMHRDGTSRKEPFHFAVLFDIVLGEYAAAEPIEKTHDFLIEAVHSWGLVPISQVSATAIQAYLRHRRYDLITEWLATSRRLWPYVENNSTEFALALAKAWEEIDASCEEVENTCISLLKSYDIVNSRRLRTAAQEALANHLAYKLQVINSGSTAVDGHANPDIDELDLSGLLRSAFAIISENAGETGVVTRSDVADLVLQSNAVLRLREMFGLMTRVKAPNVKVPGELVEASRRQTSSAKAPRSQTSTIAPAELRQTPLPPYETLLSVISTYYTQRSEQAEPINHDILKMTCDQLSRPHRYYAIVGLISAVCDHPAVQGPEGVQVDIEVMEIWLEAAYRMKSPHACRKMLHTLVNSGSTIQLTPKFMALMRTVGRKLNTNRFSRSNRNHERVADDLRYSMHVLLQRFYTQRKALDREQRRYGPLFDEEYSDTRRSPVAAAA